MRTYSKTTRISMVFISLALFFVLAGLNLSVKSTSLQEASTPTPTATQILVKGEPVPASPDTEGLIMGAGIILVIIIGGVLIQRIIQKQNSSEKIQK